MSAYIELRVKPNARAFIEAGTIAGIVTAEKGRADVVATHEKPLLIILRGGETLETYGESPAELILRMMMIRKEVRELGLDIKCAMLDAPHAETDESSGAN